LTERTNDQILETEHGFATYRFIPDQKAVYIIDIFVDRDFRDQGLAGLMADKIAEIAKKQGYVKMLGSVVPSFKGSGTGLNVLLSYGMTLKAASQDFITLEKDI
jgi:GNAT superfamily N-acetyltransferase